MVYFITPMSKFTDKERKLYFLGGCIPVRLAIAYLVYHVDSAKKKKPVVSKSVVLWLLLLISMSLLFAHVRRGMSTDQTQKGFFGSEVYWNNAVHSLMYAVAAMMLDAGYSYPWAPLVIDVLIALYTFHGHYF